MAFQNCQMNNEKSQFKRYMSGTVKQNQHKQNEEFNKNKKLFFLNLEAT